MNRILSALSLFALVSMNISNAMDPHEQHLAALVRNEHECKSSLTKLKNRRDECRAQRARILDDLGGAANFCKVIEATNKENLFLSHEMTSLEVHFLTNPEYQEYRGEQGPFRGRFYYNNFLKTLIVDVITIVTDDKANKKERLMPVIGACYHNYPHSFLKREQEEAIAAAADVFLSDEWRARMSSGSEGRALEALMNYDENSHLTDLMDGAEVLTVIKKEIDEAVAQDTKNADKLKEIRQKLYPAPQSKSSSKVKIAGFSASGILAVAAVYKLIKWFEKPKTGKEVRENEDDEESLPALPCA